MSSHSTPSSDAPSFPVSASQTLGGVVIHWPPSSAPKHDRELQRPLCTLGLPIRGANALRRAGLMFVEDVLDWSEKDLLTLPHFGHASLCVLERYLRQVGLEFQPQSKRRRRL
jgi:DNA-directed RNA polymerase alpha subunit